VCCNAEWRLMFAAMNQSECTDFSGCQNEIPKPLSASGAPPIRSPNPSFLDANRPQQGAPHFLPPTLLGPVDEVDSQIS